MPAYLFFRFVVFLFWLMPFWLLYGLSNVLYYLLYYIIGYRKKVVRENLSGAFPNKSKEELLLLERRFYRHLCDITLEGIKGFTLSKKQILARYRIHEQAMVNEYYRRGQSILAWGSHCANWEWGAIGVAQQFEAPVLILFNPIKNQYINNYVKRSREMYNTRFGAIRHTQAAFDEALPKPHIFIFLADQSPSNLKAAHWLPFLNRETAMLHGPAKYALKYNFPVVFFRTKRTKRGYYEVFPELLTECPSDFSAVQLTREYVQRLESLIAEEPAHWLWSHKRWKHKKTV